MPGTTAAGIRRRQPLLRGGGRLHPSRRAEDAGPLHAVGRGGWEAAPAGRGKDQPLHPRPDLRPLRQARRPQRLLQGQGLDHRPGIGLRRARPGAAPYRARRPGSWSWTSRGWPGRCCSRPSASAWKGPAGDPPALRAAFTGFNRWLHDDWTFNYQDRLFPAPYLSLATVDWALAELEFALANDARVINLSYPGRSPTPGGTGPSAIPPTTPSGPGSTKPASPWPSRRGRRLRLHARGVGGQPRLPGVPPPMLFQLLTMSPISDTVARSWLTASSPGSPGSAWPPSRTGPSGSAPSSPA